MAILGKSVTQGVTPITLRSHLMKLVLVIVIFTMVCIQYFKTPFRLNFIEIGMANQQQTNVSLYKQNSSTSPNFSNILKIDVSKFIPVEPVTRTESVTSPDTSEGPRVEIRPSYITAPFMGRLGNHMFIYASLLGIASAQNRTAFIRSGTILESAFEITHVNNNISTAGFLTLRETKYAAFDTRFQNLPKVNITLAGYLQVWKYFRNIDEHVRREFTFSASVKKSIREILEKFGGRAKGHVLVGVHVRRGDFLSGRNQRAGYGVAKASYFIGAFERMRSLLNNTNITFVVGSDDLGWCRKNLNFTGVKILEPGSALLHFGVLASCDHVILAGGTYGWWSAWLANGITIYYNRYLAKGTPLMAGADLQDYYPPGWIGLGD